MGRDERAELLTPTDVRRLLHERGLAPRRADGQNFVVDPNTVRKVVRDAGVTASDRVLEIGAGLGSLTLALAERARAVVAVELDSGLVEVVRELTADLGNVAVVHADALALDLDELLAERPARLVANLPYNVATPMVFHALASRSVTDLFVMVQREVAERWRARVGDAQYGGVSVKLALVADVEIVAEVPRAVFHPVPRVDSVTVRIVRRDDALDPGEYRRVADVVDAAFATRRKTIRNALRRAFDDERVAQALATAGVDPGARAEELGPTELRRLAAALGPQP